MAKTISELRNQSIQVRDASAAGENTATRVGTVLNDIVGHIEDYENTQSSNNSSQDAKIEGVKSSLNAEIARAKTEESNLSTLIGTERTERQAAVSREETARIQADNDEKTARQQADNAEQDARIKADNDEKTARENADITLRTMIQTEVSNRQIAVKQEEIRAKAAEQANTQAIADEKTRATTAEAAETARAKAEEERLQGEIDNTNTNVETLEDKVNSNHDHLTEEVARLDLTDNEIKADLEAETTRAQAAEKANAQAITEEKAAIIGTDRIADGAVTIEKVADSAFDDVPTAGSDNLVKSGGVADKISELESKTSEISKKVIVTEEDSISIEDNNGNKVFHLDENGLDAKNVKSNGKEVLTEHQDISGLATKEEMAEKQDYIPTISQEEIHTEDEEIELKSNSDERIYAIKTANKGRGKKYFGLVNPETSETYLAVNKNGISGKGFYDTSGRPIGKVIRVNKEGNGDFTSFVRALYTSYSELDITILVDEGVYDIEQELKEIHGDSYFDSMQEWQCKNYRECRGLMLMNRVHIICSSNSKFIFNYKGTNKWVLTWFSPFNAGKHGFTLENATIECSRCRYAMHDERGDHVINESYNNYYYHCNMYIDNSNNEQFNAKVCIGGGLGKAGNIVVKDCVFEAEGMPLDSTIGVVFWHNNLLDGSKSHIVFSGNLIKGYGTFGLQHYGTSKEKTVALLTNNSLGKAPILKKTTEDSVENTEYIMFNNEIRN